MGNPENKIEELSYEQAIEELDAIVASLENEELALEKAINLFERRRRLAGHCASLLEKAELRVRSLEEEQG